MYVCIYVCFSETGFLCVSLTVLEIMGSIQWASIELRDLSVSAPQELGLKV